MRGIEDDKGKIGKYLVYQTMFRSRWAARQIVGQTNKFWILNQPKRWLDHMHMVNDDSPKTKRMKKASIGRHAFFDDEDEAIKAADGLTAELLKIDKEIAAEASKRRGAAFAKYLPEIDGGSQ